MIEFVKIDREGIINKIIAATEEYKKLNELGKYEKKEDGYDDVFVKKITQKLKNNFGCKQKYINETMSVIVGRIVGKEINLNESNFKFANKMVPGAMFKYIGTLRIITNDNQLLDTTDNYVDTYSMDINSIRFLSDEELTDALNEIDDITLLGMIHFCHKNNDDDDDDDDDD